jgi:hypothetical protein
MPRLHERSGLPFDVRETKRLRSRIQQMPLATILNPQLRASESERRNLASVASWRAEREQQQRRRQRRRGRVTAVAR